MAFDLQTVQFDLRNVEVMRKSPDWATKNDFALRYLITREGMSCISLQCGDVERIRIYVSLYVPQIREHCKVDCLKKREAGEDTKAYRGNWKELGGYEGWFCG